MNSSSVGSNGEELATVFLKGLGYKILQRNFHSRLGEIDIIAKDKNQIVFVEVKSRKKFDFGQPAESINSKKLQAMIKTGQYYLLVNKITDADYRFDAVEVFLNNFGSNKINHIKNITF